MSRIHSAPIPALIDYYKRLADDPNADVAPFGFSRQKISFRVVIELDGRLHAIQDAREQENGRPMSISLIVPGQSKPSGQGINPCFLWDNAQYMLGVKADDPKPERTAKAFAAFRQRHLDLASEIDDEHYAAVCRFLEHWDPARVNEVEGHELLEELGGGFGVFHIHGEPGYVHRRPAILEYWNQQCDAAAAASDDRPTGQSLVSGRVATLARLHEPKIKGVIGGQSSGGVLVGFNDDAYTSFGKLQSYNAPVAEDEAFEYCTALNRLLASSNHRVRVGDSTVVFWSDRPHRFESLAAALFGAEVGEQESAEHAGTTAQVRSFLDAVRRGVAHEGVDDPDAPFYVLGLSPNAARVSVRFWLTGTVSEFAERLKRHVDALEIIGARDEKPLTIRRLLLETAREARDIPPQLAGEVSRAVLSGSRYPQALLSAVLRRVRADATMYHPRAAIIKACLIRNYEMEVPVSLNKDHPDPAYHMGRLFAALEAAQRNALGDINRTIKDTYFTSASTTPAAVFPRLMKVHQHHIEKAPTEPNEARRERKRTKRFFDSLVQEIMSHIDLFPAHLPLERQGLFHIGYYHQRQNFFTKRETADEGELVAVTSEEVQ